MRKLDNLVWKITIYLCVHIYREREEQHTSQMQKKHARARTPTHAQRKRKRKFKSLKQVNIHRGGRAKRYYTCTVLNFVFSDPDFGEASTEIWCTIRTCLSFSIIQFKNDGLRYT